MNWRSCETWSASMTPIGYPHLPLGLNNQKLALLGVFIRARDLASPLALPQFCNFDAIASRHTLVPIETVYSIDHLRRFAAAFGIDLVTERFCDNENGQGCFTVGGTVSTRDLGLGSAMLDEFTCQFFSSLVPIVRTTETFKYLWHKIFRQLGVSTVLQLRVENDWIAAAANLRGKPDPFEDDYDLGYLEILKKVKDSFADLGRGPVYVVCDEANLPVPKEKIRQDAAGIFGLDLVWKSDILWPEELVDLSILDKSLIDFEMTVTAPVFVGFSRSTFANLAAMEAFCRNGTPPAHYIYNHPGPLVARRHDFGTQVNPAMVVDRLYERAPLIADQTDDCLWRAILTAHIGRIGDLPSAASPICGTRRGHLVAGIVGDAERMIQGFSIVIDDTLPGSLEYRARLANGVWTEWQPAGTYAGTRGRGESLRGFAVRLIGRLALGYGCSCAGSFAGRVVCVGDGEDCMVPDDAPLEAMQLVFRPVIGKPPAIWTPAT